MRTAERLEQEEGRLAVTLSDGKRVATTAVVLATGASYRMLEAPGVQELQGAGVYYGGATAEAQLVEGEDVYIVGGANSAGQAALYLARYARSVTLLVRGQSLAAGMSRLPRRPARVDDNVSVRVRTTRSSAPAVTAGSRSWCSTTRAPTRDETVRGGGALRHDRRATAHGVAPTARSRAMHAASCSRAPTCRRGPGMATRASALLLESSMPAVFAAGTSAMAPSSGWRRGRRGLGRDPARPLTAGGGQAPSRGRHARVARCATAGAAPAR